MRALSTARTKKELTHDLAKRQKEAERGETGGYVYFTYSGLVEVGFLSGVAYGTVLGRG